MDDNYKIYKFPLLKSPEGGIDTIITDFPLVKPLAIKEQDGRNVLWAIVYTGANRVSEYQVRGVMTGEPVKDLMDWGYIDTRTYGIDGSYIVHYFFK